MINCTVKQATGEKEKFGKPLREALRDIVSTKGGKCCGLTHDYAKADHNDCSEGNCINEEKGVAEEKSVSGKKKYGDKGLLGFAQQEGRPTELSGEGYEYCYHYRAGKDGKRENHYTKNGKIGIEHVPSCHIYLPEQEYDLAWEKNAEIRKATKLSAFFNGGDDNGEDTLKQQQLFYTHPKVTISETRKVTTITQIGDGGFFSFQKMKSVEINNLRFKQNAHILQKVF